MEFGGETTTTTPPNIMGTLAEVILILLVISGLFLAAIYFSKYIGAWSRSRGREQHSTDSVLLQIIVSRDNEIKIDAVEQLFGALYTIKKNTGRFNLKAQSQISFEIVAMHESIKFFVCVHKSLRDLVEKQIFGAYPDAEIKMVPEYDIYPENAEIAFAQLVLKSQNFYPIKTFRELPTDPLSALTSALGKMQNNEGAAVQMIISPADSKWKEPGKKFVKKEKDPGKPDAPKPAPDAKQLEAVETKISKSGFNTVVRLVASAATKDEAKSHLSNMKAAFEQFSGPYNSFTSAKIHSEHHFITDFVYRYIPQDHPAPVLTPDELASIFHFPNKSIETPFVIWLASKRAPAPEKIPNKGLYLGKSVFRGTSRPVFISDYDRTRHMYIIGRTGSGKSELLMSMMLQDILAGKGLCFIDPHGDAAETMLKLIPAERAKDVIYLNPGDVTRPIGMNMLEATTEDQKHFIVSQILGLMYKLYDPNKTGIIGPRFEHGVRNAMLTVMSVPGNTFLEVVRVMTDENYLREILPHVQDPIVRRYWTDQIAKTADFHKSEVLDYTVSKFGRFVTNKMMRNIIGQSESTFNLRTVMDEGKILIVNLAKGQIGEENSNFLGLILVPKILAAAMSRTDIPEEQRKDFYLYVDEFQNFATDTFATILSEARKYKLNLIVANQFIGQMPEDVKNAVFGNVGTLAAFRVGVADANFLQHEFKPTFGEPDLINIDRYHAYVKTQVMGEPVVPFSIDTTKDMKAWNSLQKEDVAEAIKELSRLTYGKDEKEVEAAIVARANL